MIGSGLNVTFELKGETALAAHLDHLPIELRAKLLPTIESLTQRLLAGVRAAEPMRTGRLRAATRSFVDSGPDFVRGRVRVGAEVGKRAGGFAGHNVAAAALEYGVHAVEHVGAHRERVGRGFVAVEAYTRRVNMAARRFLRDPFERIRPVAEAEIRRVLAEKLSQP